MAVTDKDGKPNHILRMHILPSTQVAASQADEVSHLQSIRPADYHPVKKAGTPTKVPAFFYSQTGVIGMMIFLNPPPVLIIGLSSCCNLSEKAYTIFRICARR